MPIARLEHVNLTITDLNRSVDLLKNLCGWEIRWEGPAMGGGHTVHIGSDTDYLALYTNGGAKGGYAKGAPLNHVGLLVDDLDEAERIVIAAGLTPFGHGDYDPGRRFYFFDWDGIEFEIINYS